VGDSTTLGSYISDDQDIAARVTDHLALQWARAELTLGEQKVLVRRYEDECTQTEIADRLGLSQMHRRPAMGGSRTPWCRQSSPSSRQPNPLGRKGGPWPAYAGDRDEEL